MDNEALRAKCLKEIQRNVAILQRLDNPTEKKRITKQDVLTAQFKRH